MFSFFKKLYLPVGLIFVFVMVILFPGITSSLNKRSIIQWLVAAIFVVNGFQLNLVEVKLGRSFFLVFVLVAIINLIIGPIVGTAVSRMMTLSSGLALGLIVISTVPSTLSSGVVLTEVAGGNILWGLMLTIGLSLIGIFTIPFMLSICLKIEEGVSISAIGLLIKLVKIVLAPFFAGYFLKKLIKPESIPALVRFVPSTCIILAVWLTLAASRNELITINLMSIGMIILCSLMVHGILLLLCGGTARALKFSAYDSRAIIFVGSQKTLPVAVSVLACIGGETGLAIMVCLVFHFTQLLLDSGIASCMGTLSAADKG